ncbi:unnamed protein product [Linum trigynum]|uniref:Nicotianamine synthase n=1 Tax=Linum trigynum TaxID=586398 RepID=A0AAV2GD76_9ROSI
MGACQQQDLLVKTVCDLYDQISALDSLKPSKDVDTLFTQLVSTCIPPSPIDVNKLCHKVQEIRSNLIKLCGQAEGHLESHYSAILGSHEKPLHHLDIFPYYSNYLKLSLLEFNLLKQQQQSSSVPKRVAFLGSGPLPLTSIVLATNHLTTTSFHNYDIDARANELALALVSSDPDLSVRMFFHTVDVMELGSDELKEFDVVFLAALVGMDKEMKLGVIRHLAKHMAPGAILMLRSAHGARAFLYPVVEPSHDLQGFEVLSVYHPTDEVINSVVVARKQVARAPLAPMQLINDNHHQQQQTFMVPSCKCSEIAAFKPLGNHHGCMMIEELTMEEQLS